MTIGLSVTGHVEAAAKTVRFYVEMRGHGLHFGFNGRFSQLRALHLRLGSLLKHVDVTLTLPPFPPKHILDNMSSPANVARREAELFDYYTRLCTIDDAVVILAQQPIKAPTETDGVEFTPVQKSSRR
ncbi:hypothetical protein SPRG_09397 [Saprolegnia parasitica CBS 223.65]|uniref:PX domain-containing protein n=1 Tax=Saprolegnia parasitica (strain CBS 223.65) TaxID=695850 RepID=A0A067C3T2_SAPPC|nr:hypothetical protein SPRG_09397 [Saprolegnia parasitica CBS 223.65]KDO25454.1 hypothetical protein SPRG_09397 [Saprolegnia parasitica CBS 223.65]|eukprot:XP_012203880.1 hypothetical protein SPRG_09397 [Saprolegnia parasitica CBS 223.65]